MSTTLFLQRSCSLTCAGALLLLAAPIPVHGQFNYITNIGAITITGYTGTGGAVDIPAAINGLPVTSIGYAAFYYTGLTSVTIPNSVTYIGDSAFDSCFSLTNATIGNGVTYIDAFAFQNCGSLTCVTIPDGVGSIWKWRICFHQPDQRADPQQRYKSRRRSIPGLS